MRYAPHPLLLPLRLGFGAYLARFHAQLVGDTPAMRSFMDREFKDCVVMAPGRMIDQVNEMMDKWRANDNSGEVRAVSALPVMIVAFSRDLVPSAADRGQKPIADPTPVTIPGDPKQRMFKLRTVPIDVRVQVAIAASEPLTAQSIAMQLHLYATARQIFRSRHILGGIMTEWPVQLETPDIISVATPTEAKNLTILACDFQLQATIPLLSAPRMGDDDADGSGTDNMTDPDGYATLLSVVGRSSQDAEFLTAEQRWSTDDPVPPPWPVIDPVPADPVDPAGA